MLIHTTGLTETATTGNLLPNAGTGQTSVQHSNSTIDGINNSSNWTLNNITDYSSNYNELEAQGTGTVSANGSLLNISAGDHTTTADSLDGGVTLTSKTEVQNCEWVGSSSQCGQATSGRDSYSTTVNILDEDENVLATVTQNRNTDSGYNNNTFTYTDTVTHTGEGARKWEWEWQGVDGNSPNSTSPVGPNLLGAELKATLLNILYSPLPVAIKEEIEDIFEELITEFEEIEEIVELEEEFEFEELSIEEEPIEMEEPIMVVMMAITEEETMEEEIVFEEIVMEEEKEEEEPVMEIIEMFTEEETEEEEPVEMITEAVTEEENQQPEEVNEEKEESNSEATETANAQEESGEKQKEVRSEKTKTVQLDDVLNKIDEKIKDIDKNLQLKNLVKLKVMSSSNLLEAYNIPFYEPKIIYEDQLNIEDNRIIYTKDLVEYKQADPIFIQKEQLNIILQERQNLISEIEALQNG
tara:strand:+ start:269 stop:1678 length:1410 start_codon:yes stop_codon:yes gene_type:complete